MLKYISKRMLQMIPTVFGVILITFILFNMVGGSPALQVLGRHVSPQSLEEFDEQRGFNKPLFLGTRTGTRAYEDSHFKQGPGVWDGAEGTLWTNGLLRLAEQSELKLPLKFALRTDSRYELKVKTKAGPGIKEIFEGTEKPVIRSGETPLEIRSITLRRVMRNPFDSQFTFYLRQLARLDFGVSHSTNQRVSRLILDGIGPSLMLTVPIFFAGLVTAVFLSMICAFWRDTWVDRFFVIFSVALMSVNYLVWIVAGQYLLAYKLGWFPVWGFEDPRYLVLPVLIGVFSGLGAELRFYRTIMLDEAHRDYVRTARAKGVGRAGVLFKHVLKNAMIPIITNTVIAIPFLYTGSLLLESFFGIPGLGYLGINAINSSDVDVLRAIVLIGSILFVIANLLTDLCYALVDPRVKLK
jgi:peptide/nickel transport system permease protein